MIFICKNLETSGDVGFSKEVDRVKVVAKLKAVQGHRGIRDGAVARPAARRP